MHNWYLIQTKVNQERLAVTNLHNQKFITYFPTIKINNKITPLFPRYIFIKIFTEQNIHPVKSTIGVLSIVRFGKNFAKVSQKLVDLIQKKERQMANKLSNKLTINPGDNIKIIDGIFKGYDAIFTETNGINRVNLLLKIMNREQLITLKKKHIKKVISYY